MTRRSLSLESAADLLDTSPDTIRRMMDCGQLRGHYLNRQRRVYAESISEYQDGHTIQPKGEAGQPAKRRVVRAETDAARALKELGL